MCFSWLEEILISGNTVPIGMAVEEMLVYLKLEEKEVHLTRSDYKNITK